VYRSSSNATATIWEIGGVGGVSVNLSLLVIAGAGAGSGPGPFFAAGFCLRKLSIRVSS
jgi:hypothetical protein